MKIKIEFVLKETGECVLFETTLDDTKKHEFVFITNYVNGEEYVYVISGTKIWRPMRNVICAERVDLLSLKVEYDFE